MTSSPIPEGSPRWPSARTWGLAGIGMIAVLVGLLVAFSSGTPGSGPLRLAVSGRAVVEGPAGEHHVVEGSRRLELGSLVEMVTGSATLEYPDGTTFELRAGVGRADDTTLLAASTPELRTGDVLVVEAGGASIEAAGSRVDMNGTGKVARRLSLLTQVYEGDAEITSGGRSVVVPALRQASVPAARLVPAAPSPFSYDPSDSWDRRYLGEAIALGDELLSRARGFTAQLGAGEGRTAGFYRLLLPDLETQPGFDGSMIDGERPPGETLVGAAITVAAINGQADGGEFAGRWASVFSFREAGAHWGLVALDHGVERDPLVDQLEAAIARAPLSQVALGSPNGGTGGGGPLLPPSGGQPPGGGSSPPPDDGGGGGGEPTPPTTEPPDVIDDLIEGLLEPLPGSDDDSSSDDTTGDDSGGLLGGLLDTTTTTITTLDDAGGLLGG